MYEDLTGQKFGKLTVLELVDKKANKISTEGRTWECLCDCGKITFAKTHSLKTGHTKSCGCLRKKTAEGKIFDLTGRRFGKLTVISRAGNINGHTSWLCKCDCGNFRIIKGYSLKRGSIKSCGCLRRKNEYK